MESAKSARSSVEKIALRLRFTWPDRSDHGEFVMINRGCQRKGLIFMLSLAFFLLLGSSCRKKGRTGLPGGSPGGLMQAGKLPGSFDGNVDLCNDGPPVLLTQVLEAGEKVDATKLRVKEIKSTCMPSPDSCDSLIIAVTPDMGTEEKPKPAPDYTEYQVCDRSGGCIPEKPGRLSAGFGTNPEGIPLTSDKVTLKSPFYVVLSSYKVHN